MKRIKKILIANRGEIAVRIHRSAQELGIKTVAVFSDVDRCAPHVLLCTEAYPLRGITSRDTYLNIDKILEIAKQCNADAIHPGYGFLSEKSQFAKAVEEAGLIFIGPKAETIELLGSKTAARELMEQNKIPIVPGTVKPIVSISEAKQIAEKIGYPVLIKASGGGGGKGMRKVESEAQLENAFERARNEALNAFSDDRIYLEKFIVNPKHIEIQIIADCYGNAIHLGERDCSIQRRHQKVVEETPSVALNEELRSKIGAAAVAISKASGYKNAGTVEFLLDEYKNFYFLEVNARIQVEHPVTELVYGIDLIKEQIRIAEGHPLSISQENVYRNGHSIECRIYAEDCDNNFSPSTGKIKHYQPSEGVGVRNDSGIRTGYNVTSFYDPMLAKLIVHGRNREEAIAKMKRALLEYKINGVKTTIPFCSFVMNHKEFVEGTYTIKFVENNFTPLLPELHSELAKAVAATYVEQNKLQQYPLFTLNRIAQNSRWKKKAK